MIVALPGLIRYASFLDTRSRILQRSTIVRLADMEESIILLDVVVLLGTALLLGIVFERLKQNAVVGYLVAGILLGPAGIGFLHTIEQLRALAELGVALLLFTIGLEFSFRKLREMGGVAVIGGSFQILVTGGVAGWMALHHA